MEEPSETGQWAINDIEVEFGRKFAPQTELAWCNGKNLWESGDLRSSPCSATNLLSHGQVISLGLFFLV